MAKKKKSSSAAKSKPAAKSKAASGSAVSRKVNTKPSTKAAVKTPAKKATSSAKAPATKPVKPTKKTPAKSGAKSAGKTAGTTGTRKTSESGGRNPQVGTGRTVAAAVVSQVPDAQGYVLINGRRVRAISTKGVPVKKKSHRDSEAKAQAAELEQAIKNVKTKLGKKELDHYRDLLLIKRAELCGLISSMEAEALRSSGGNLSHMPIHMADIGTDTYDQDFKLGMAEAERQLIVELDHALERIDNKTYGVCQMTGKPIPKARLEAKPWAKYTIEAARLVESGRHRP